MSIKSICIGGVTLADDPPLWRYMELSKLLMLLDGKAFLPSVAELQQDDPWEGDLLSRHGEAVMGSLSRRLGDEKFRALAKYLEAQAKPEEKKFFLEIDYYSCQQWALGRIYLRELAKSWAVWCWFEGERESAAMWSLYGKKGAAVRSRFSRLCQALPKDGAFEAARMAYMGENDVRKAEGCQAEELFDRPHFLKRPEYSHEKELRVATKCASGAQGRLVENIDLSQLLEEIVISPWLPAGEAEAVLNEIGTHNALQSSTPSKGLPLTDPPVVRVSSLLGRKEREKRSMEQGLRTWRNAECAGAGAMNGLSSLLEALWDDSGGGGFA